jgi:putative ABC transport system permease protein
LNHPSFGLVGVSFAGSQEQRIAAVPGVKARACALAGSAGFGRMKRISSRNFAVDADRIHEIMPELKMSDAEWQAFIKDKQGAIVGAKLVKLYGFAPGQRITLRSPNL